MHSYSFLLVREEDPIVILSSATAAAHMRWGRALLADHRLLLRVDDRGDDLVLGIVAMWGASHNLLDTT